MKIQGTDISHHQRRPNWSALAAGTQFVIVRSTYGKRRDRLCIEHVRNAKAHGLAVGVYHFFRPTQPVLSQIDACCSAADAAGIVPGDIVPALDIEKDPFGADVSPAIADAAHQAAELLSSRYGSPCLIYLTQRDWTSLGRPDWVKNFKLWVAHWTHAQPATPAGLPWVLWQYRVGPFSPGATHRWGDEERAGAIDHNVASFLPLIPEPPLDPTHMSGFPAYPLAGLEFNRDAIRSRKAIIEGEIYEW